MFRILFLMSLICSLTLPTAATANQPCHDYGTPYDGTPYSMGYVGILCGQENLNSMDQVIAEYPAIWNAAQQNSSDNGNSNNSSNETCFDFQTPYGGQVDTLGYIGLVCGQENINWMNQLITNYYNEWAASQGNGNNSGESNNPPGQVCHDYGTPFAGTEYPMGYIGLLCGQETLNATDLLIGAHQAAWYATQQNGLFNENSNIYTPSNTIPLTPPILCASFSVPPPNCSIPLVPSNSGIQSNSSVSSGPVVGEIQDKIESGVPTPKVETKLAEKIVETKKPVTSAKTKKSAGQNGVTSSATKSLSCKKGNKTVTIKAKNPKCPSGYKKVA